MEGCDCEFCEYWFGWVNVDDTPDVSSVHANETAPDSDAITVPDSQ